MILEILFSLGALSNVIGQNIYSGDGGGWAGNLDSFTVFGGGYGVVPASIFTLPTTNGSAGQSLKTDGSGNTYWG